MYFWIIVYIAIIAFLHAAIAVFCDIKKQWLIKNNAKPEEIAKYDLKAKRKEVLEDFQDMFPFTKPIFKLFSSRRKRKDKKC